MTAIVLNTATGAVTESSWAFQSMSATHAASPSGLFALGGETDNGAAIDARFVSGKPGGGVVQNIGKAFVAGDTDGGQLIVQGLADEWEYPVATRSSGVAVATPGRGIRESYLAFGYRNEDGKGFRLDSVDVELFPSTNRRT